MGGLTRKIISRNRKGLKQKTREKGSESVQERQEPACLSSGCRRGGQPGRVSLRGGDAMVTKITGLLLPFFTAPCRQGPIVEV